MTRVRLRPAYTDAELAEVYALPHRHDRWDDHKLRVASTIMLANWHTRELGRLTLADLSCGDGAIARGIKPDRAYLGDIAPGYSITGPIEQTIHQVPQVDLFVCSETIEHLDDPDSVLAAMRMRTDHLVLSTPIDEQGGSNPQHYWSWGKDDVREMLIAAGFTPTSCVVLELRPHFEYDYQIWACT